MPDATVPDKVSDNQEEENAREKISAACVRLFPYINYFEKRPDVIAADEPWGYVYNEEAKKFRRTFRECGIYEFRFTPSGETADELRKIIASADMKCLWGILDRFTRPPRSGFDQFSFGVREGLIADILIRLRELCDADSSQ